MATSVQIVQGATGAPPQNTTKFPQGNGGPRQNNDRERGGWGPSEQRECFYCHKKGHLANVCRMKARHEQQRQNDNSPPPEQTQQGPPNNPSQYQNGGGQATPQVPPQGSGNWNAGQQQQQGNIAISREEPILWEEGRIEWRDSTFTQ